MGRLSLLIVIMILQACGPLRALLAPEAVVGEAVARTADSGSRTLDQAAANQAVGDLDRIIAEHGQASNVDELRRLRQDLDERPLPVTRPPADPVVQRAPVDDFDRRRPASTASSPSWGLPQPGQVRFQDPRAQAKGDRLVSVPPDPHIHRGEGTAFAAGSTHDLPPPRRRVYEMDFPRPPNDVGSRRDGDLTSGPVPTRP